MQRDYLFMRFYFSLNEVQMNTAQCTISHACGWPDRRKHKHFDNGHKLKS